ncbi:hypothetical protein BX666DRAFT_1988045 [Dichotomocladium elegans]|nr:hypothetical protein BX666DRAFT_1988045 [Dichotomocladium elegans]
MVESTREQEQKPGYSHAKQTEAADTALAQSPTSYEYSPSVPPSRTSTSSRSFNPFKRSDSPSNGRPRAVERPSQAFRERQSKRMSEFYRNQSAPSSPCNAPRMSTASGGSYYDMLMSKFGRQSEEQVPPLPRDSAKHAALKEEARSCIESHKEEMPEVDWGMFVKKEREGGSARVRARVCIILGCRECLAFSYLHIPPRKGLCSLDRLLAVHGE